MSNPANLPPGFRFHPTDEELIVHYLRSRSSSVACPVTIIADVDIYKSDPWDLPGKAFCTGDKEWYFFSPRDRKYPNGIRPNRAAGSGYWKATGTDKPIFDSKTKESIGVKKALVFYRGRPPKGLKTNWIMHEYRLADAHAANTYRPMKFKNTSMRLDDWVLCRIYKKSGNLLPVVPPLTDPERDFADSPAVDERTAGSYYDFRSPPPTGSFSHLQTTTGCYDINMHRTTLPPAAELFEDYSVLSRFFDAPAEISAAELMNGTHQSGAGSPFYFQNILVPEIPEMQSTPMASSSAADDSRNSLLIPLHGAVHAADSNMQQIMLMNSSADFQ